MSSVPLACCKSQKSRACVLRNIATTDSLIITFRACDRRQDILDGLLITPSADARLLMPSSTPVSKPLSLHLHIRIARLTRCSQPRHCVRQGAPCVFAFHRARQRCGATPRRDGGKGIILSDEYLDGNFRRDCETRYDHDRAGFCRPIVTVLADVEIIVAASSEIDYAERK